MILAEPVVKFIDYGNAVFEGDEKPFPIHTKQLLGRESRPESRRFRAPEVILKVKEGWGPPSDTWTVGVSACYLLTGQLMFNSHEPEERSLKKILEHAWPESIESIPIYRLKPIRRIDLWRADPTRLA